MGTSLNQSGRAIEIVGLTMLVYLTLSLSTSALMNWYNARVALVER
jgi:general L-amino acid transport system permease protein